MTPEVEIEEVRQMLRRQRAELQRVVHRLQAATAEAEDVLDRLAGRPDTVFLDRTVWLGGD